MPTTDRAGRARRTPDTTAGRPRLPSPQALSAAGLVAVESTHDGRCHVVHEAHYVGELATTHTGPPRVRGLCGDLLLLGSLTTEPVPPCARCATGPEVIGAADARRQPAGRRSRLRDRVRSAGRTHTAEHR